jgi:hypothetical protein
MLTNSRSAFDPRALKQLYGAFDAAWNTIKDDTSDTDREAARDAMGRAIVGLARHGYTNVEHLAHYGAYRGRLFIDLRC